MNIFTRLQRIENTKSLLSKNLITRLKTWVKTGCDSNYCNNCLFTYSNGNRSHCSKMYELTLEICFNGQPIPRKHKTYSIGSDTDLLPICEDIISLSRLCETKQGCERCLIHETERSDVNCRSISVVAESLSITLRERRLCNIEG